MRRLWLFGLLLALAACRERGPVEGAVRVSITYGSYTPACLRVTASDSQGHTAQTDVPQSEFQTPDKHQVTLAVFRKPEWEHALILEVTSYEDSSDGSCSGRVLEQHRSPEPVAVPQGTFETFPVTLLAQDDDHDHYILKTDTVAGTDCDDTLDTVHPGQPEACTGERDFDCDGSAGCADPECLDKSCDDHNPCTLSDQCRAGAGPTAECVGTPKTCQPPNLTCYTSESACNPATGECVHTQRPASQSCNDGDACTSNDECGLDASCKGAPTIKCDVPPSACHESLGVCDAANGTCSYKYKDSTAACDDSNACTQNDRCNGAGSCAGDMVAPCVPSDACHRSERNCPSNATCVETVDASQVNHPCTKMDFTGVCRADGVCSSFPYIPSNFDPDSILAADRGLDFIIDCGSPADPVIFDSDTFGGSAPAGCTFPPTPTPRVVNGYTVVPIRNFTITAGHALKLRGSRPVIFAIYGNATLSGALLADADLETPGAGGNRASCPTKGGDGNFSSNEGSGGGGGGFGTTGAAGGKNDASAAGGTAGGSVSTTLVPLVGGCPGGVGGGTNTGGLGGAGGGALQVSVAGTLRVENWVSVSGGGARGGKRTTNNAGGGGGGGSGGGLLLEAYTLELTDQARLTANGGSGAEGGDSTGKTGSDGTDGSQSTRDPAHCADTGGDGAPGGDGGADNKAPATPGDARNNSGAGGGGGAVGVMKLRGFGTCNIHMSCNATDGNGCELSPKVTPTCG